MCCTDTYFTQYEQLVDVHARNYARAPEFVLKTFYGRLDSILVLNMPVAPRLNITKPESVILAVIKECVVEDGDAHGLDIHFYRRDGSLQVMDLACVQCLVGRVRLANGSWAILDRSGTLARAQYVDERDEQAAL
jgi:hypothetical protein